jgi:phasin family protein
MNNNFTNMFGDGFKDMMNPENFTKYSGSSNFDFTKLSNNIKKNTEALQEASQVAVETMQSMFKRGTEIVQDNASNAFSAMKEIASSGNPEQAIARQQEFVQNLMRETVCNTKEMVDTASKSAMEVFNKISKHAENNMSENMSCVMPEVKKSPKK